MLPENVMFDVLSRLPVKTIITCKSVCKKYQRGLVSDPYFVDLHLSKSREEALIILDQPSGVKPGTLKWVEIEHEHEHLEPIKILNLKQCEPPIAGGFLLCPVGSVNGLVFCRSMGNSLYVFNLVLEEYMALPPPPPRPLGFKTSGYGFGVSTAGEYKVVKILINPCENAVEIQVHTLGTDHWRRLRQTNLNLMKIQCRGVYLNGHVYWLAEDQIYDFDLSTETSELFPYPPAPEDNQEPDRMLGVLKGRLSYMCWCSSGRVEVWVRKEESANWYKEITSFSQLRPWRPLCLIDGVEEGTSVLLVHVQVAEEAEKLVAYCLNTNKILNETPFSWSNCLSIITYRPSFFKLDNFGSKRVHAMYNHSPQGLKKT